MTDIGIAYIEQYLALYKVCPHCRSYLVWQGHFAQVLVGPSPTFSSALQVLLGLADAFGNISTACIVGDTLESEKVLKILEFYYTGNNNLER